MTAHCTDCRRPLGDSAYYCDDCLDMLARVLGDLPGLLRELEVTATRQARLGDTSGPRSRKVEVYWQHSASSVADEADATSADALRRVPFHFWASDLLASARNQIVTWARIADEESDRPLPSAAAADEHGLCQYLIERLGWFRMRQESVELNDEFTWLRAKALRYIDRSAALLFAGSCDYCKDEDGKKNQNLYARIGAVTITCSPCGTVYDVADRREQMLAEAEDMLFSATVMATAVVSFGERVTPHRIHVWADRGRIMARGLDVNGHPTYRVGDVLDKLYADQLRREAKAGVA